MKKSIFLQVPTVAAYFFILLFCYASISKLLDFENFQVQIAQSPLLSAYAGFISYAVIISELIIVGFLVFAKSRLLGLYCSLGIMTSFTIYIYLILNFSDFVPCSCGGILEKMGWTEHLFFNLGCILIALISIILVEYDRMKNVFHYSLNLLAISIASTSVVVYLFYSSEYIIKKENNFTRRFLDHPILQENVINLGVDSYYFVGIQGGSLYFGNKTSPFQILKIDVRLKVKEVIKIIPQGNFKFKSLTYEVFDNKLYGFDGSVPVIYKGDMTDSEIKLQTISYQDAFFSQILILDSLHFALRTKEGHNINNVLGLLSLSNKSKVKLNKEILLGKTQNTFDTDGKLLIDYKLKELYYIYFYRNQILRINENLNLTGTMKTIDTISVSRLETVKLKDGTIKMSKPSQVNNLSTTLHDGLIFNRSGLMGKYEPKESWKSSSIIDIYKVNSSQYWGSFYVQHRGGKSLSHMLVTDQYFFALVGNDLIRYKLRKPITDGMNGDMPKNHKTE